MRNHETVIVLVLLAFNFIPQRSHQSLTLTQNNYQRGVISITDQRIFQNGKKSELHRRNNNGPKTLPCGTPDITLTSLFRQPSTITCCDRFHRNCVNIDDTEPPTPTEQSFYIENALMVDPIKGCTEIYPKDQSERPLSNALCSVWDMYKSA